MTDFELTKGKNEKAVTIELTQEEFEKIRKEIIALERKRIVKELIKANCFYCIYYKADKEYCCDWKKCETRKTVDIVNNEV